jgi:hypothetical protein
MVVSGIERLKHIEILQRHHLGSVGQPVAVVAEMAAAAAAAVDCQVSDDAAVVAE